MAGLQVLEDHYREQGFAVAGFSSNNFGKQGGSDEQIAEVTEKYGVKHDQYAAAAAMGTPVEAVAQSTAAAGQPRAALVLAVAARSTTPS